MIFIALSGLVAGAVHVVTGIDHMAALVPLSVGRHLKALRTGAVWGLGHSTGVLAVGAVALMLRGLLHVDLVSSVGERLVGAALIAIGLFAIRGALRLEIHSHVHAHDGAGPHAHLHAHPRRAVSHEPSAHHGHTAMAAGTLHGVAGSAHLFGILPALALPSRGGAALYLLMFAAGTVFAMAGFAAAVGVTTAGAARTSSRLRPALVAAGALACAVGLYWLVAPAS